MIMKTLIPGYISYIKYRHPRNITHTLQHIYTIYNNIIKLLIFNVTDVTASVYLGIIGFFRLHHNVTLM